MLLTPERPLVWRFVEYMRSGYGILELCSAKIPDLVLKSHFRMTVS
jgi:hypothetical protein